MTVFKGVRSVWINHIIAVLISLICLIPFSYISTLIPTIYSSIMLFIYLAMIYSAGWNMGKKDSRRIPGYYPNVKRAVIIALVSASITAALLAFRVAAPYIFDRIYVANPMNGSRLELADSGGMVASNVLYRLWLYPCVGFMPDGNFTAYVLMGLIIPVFVPLGYVVGLRRFSVVEKFYPKLIYKSNGKKDGDKQ